MWVTVLASQPSVSIETDTTQLDVLAELPGLPTVFITSRSRSSSVSSSASRPGKRSRYSALNSSISRGGDLLELGAHASPDSSCSLSTRIVFGRCSQRPAPSTLRNSGSCPAATMVAPSRICLLPAGDVVVDQLGDVGVVADDDEDGRRDAAAPAPRRSAPTGGNTSRSCRRGCAARLPARWAAGGSPPTVVGLAPLLRQVVADAEPEVAVGRLFAGHGVVGDRHAREP